MIKKSLYPHTNRVKINNEVVITEKMDGANLGLFNKDNELLIVTRENIIFYNEIDNKEIKEVLKTYKGLYQWLKNHGDELKENLYPGSGMFGEWMGIKGHVSYPDGIRGHKILMFAKARITEDYSIEKLMYDHDLFPYIFNDQIIPSFIDKVPIVKKCEKVPSLEELNKLYDEYSKKVNRNVEGFVINFYDNIRKYVRMKRGKLEDHHE